MKIHAFMRALIIFMCTGITQAATITWTWDPIPDHSQHSTEYNLEHRINGGAWVQSARTAEVVQSITFEHVQDDVLEARVNAQWVDSGGGIVQTSDWSETVVHPLTEPDRPVVPGGLRVIITVEVVGP